MKTQIPQGTISCASTRWGALVYLCLTVCVFPVFVHAQETITVAVASSLYADMQQKADAFEKEHDVSIRLVSGSTGRLYNQIMQGAPFDLFIAADTERPELLLDQGKAFANHFVGQGYLGVMVGKKIVTDLKQLSAPSIRHIVIANPDVAPFGKMSKKVLQQQGLWEILKHKLVYAQNAMQARMMVDKGLVDAGFVPVSLCKDSIATIDYHAALLVDKPLARNFGGEASASHAFNSVCAPEGAPPSAGSPFGSATQGECCPQQREHSGVLVAQKIDYASAPEGAPPTMRFLGGEAQGECCLPQKKHSGVSAAQNTAQNDTQDFVQKPYIVGTAEAVLPK